MSLLISNLVWRHSTYSLLIKDTPLSLHLITTKSAVAGTQPFSSKFNQRALIALHSIISWRRWLFCKSKQSIFQVVKMKFHPRPPFLFAFASGFPRTVYNIVGGFFVFRFVEFITVRVNNGLFEMGTRLYVRLLPSERCTGGFACVHGGKVKSRIESLMRETLHYKSC